MAKAPRNWDLVGHPASGYGNTVALFNNELGSWGMWDKLKMAYVSKGWTTSAEKAVEKFDADCDSVAQQKTKPVAKQTKIVKIYRERNGDKATWAKEINDLHPALGLQDIAHIARRTYPEVSVANFRYLINKLRTSQATA